jgi:hypothetical protein
MSMSVREVALKSKSRGVTRLVLLALSLEADQGSVCLASTERLAALAGIKRNHVGRHIKQLVTAGEIAVEPMAGPHRCHVYQVLLGRDESQGGAPEKTSQDDDLGSEETAFEALCALRDSAWVSFDPCGRAWHHARDSEREAFAFSEQGKRFLLEARKLAATEGISVAPTGDIGLRP